MALPLYDLNSPPSPFPLVDQNEQQHLQLFLSLPLPQHTASPSSADLKARTCCSSSSLQSAAVDGDYGSTTDNNGSSLKWTSSKMMVNNDKFPYLVHNGEETNCFSNTNNAIRVCSDCNTTTTPLWRSGPRGPKSLCNACGIRQRKARRALEAAANGAAVVTDAASLKIKVHSNKEMKKPRTVYKKQLKSKSGNICLGNDYEIGRQKKLCVKEFGLSLNNNSGLRRVFPQDVEDAAILLMELSCGLSHS